MWLQCAVRACILCSLCDFTHNALSLCVQLLHEAEEDPGDQPWPPPHQGAAPEGAEREGGGPDHQGPGPRHVRVSPAQVWLCPPGLHRVCYQDRENVEAEPRSGRGCTCECVVWEEGGRGDHIRMYRLSTHSYAHIYHTHTHACTYTHHTHTHARTHIYCTHIHTCALYDETVRHITSIKAHSLMRSPLTRLIFALHRMACHASTVPHRLARSLALMREMTRMGRRKSQIYPMTQCKQSLWYVC